MKYALSTTAVRIWRSADKDVSLKFSAGAFSTAVSVYIRKVNTLNPLLILNAAGKSTDSLLVPAGTQLEAYTNAGTADLAVTKVCCS